MRDLSIPRPLRSQLFWVTCHPLLPPSCGAPAPQASSPPPVVAAEKKKQKILYLFPRLYLLLGYVGPDDHHRGVVEDSAH